MNKRKVHLIKYWEEDGPKFICSDSNRWNKKLGTWSISYVTCKRCLKKKTSDKGSGDE